MSCTWASLGRSAVDAVASACHDINILPASYDLETFESQTSIRGAFARLEIVFVSMPRADEMDLVNGKFLSQPAAVGTDYILDLVHHDAFAGRSTLVHAQVFVSVKLALPMEHADFMPLVGHDAALAIRKFRCLGNKHFQHSQSMTLNGTRRQRSRIRENQNQTCGDPHCVAVRSRAMCAHRKREAPGWIQPQFSPPLPGPFCWRVSSRA